MWCSPPLGRRRVAKFLQNHQCIGAAQTDPELLPTLCALLEWRDPHKTKAADARRRRVSQVSTPLVRRTQQAAGYQIILRLDLTQRLPQGDARTHPKRL